MVTDSEEYPKEDIEEKTRRVARTLTECLFLGNRDFPGIEQGEGLMSYIKRMESQIMERGKEVKDAPKVY